MESDSNSNIYYLETPYHTAIIVMLRILPFYCVPGILEPLSKNSKGSFPFCDKKGILGLNKNKINF